MIRISADVSKEFSELLGNTGFESGGLIGSFDNDLIDTFFFDEGLEPSVKEYNPNVELLQRQISVWDKDLVRFRGIIHSHIDDQHLSAKDLSMARNILKLNSFQSILMPVFVIRSKKLVWYDVGMDYVKREEYEVIS